MEKVKSYKGLGSEVKIRGLSSRYFYICFAMLMFAALFAVFSFTSWLKTFDTFSLLTELFFECLVPAVIYRAFHRRSNRPKIESKPFAVTICNRSLYCNLNRKHG